MVIVIVLVVGWGLTALLTQNRSYRACKFIGICIYMYTYISTKSGSITHRATADDDKTLALLPTNINILVKTSASVKD